MFEIRFHGKGGHGAVVASKFLAEAVAKSGYFSQSFASYGALRRGGKVESYVRISKAPVQPHCKMYHPDCLVIMDEALLSDEDVIQGLKENGRVLVNSAKGAGSFSQLSSFRVYTIDAYSIANDRGLVLPGGMPVINTTLLGALVGILDNIRLEDLKEVIREGTSKAEKNVECAVEGYERVFSSSSNEIQASICTAAKGGGRKYPAYDPEKTIKCHRCQICYILCPSYAVRFDQKPFKLFIEHRFCTGCGICIEECPRKAISWEKK